MRGQLPGCQTIMTISEMLSGRSVVLHSIYMIKTMLEEH